MYILEKPTTSTSQTPLGHTSIYLMLMVCLVYTKIHTEKVWMLLLYFFSTLDSY